MKLHTLSRKHTPKLPAPCITSFLIEGTIKGYDSMVERSWEQSRAKEINSTFPSI